ncbi:hypothetical protein EU546_04645, partial [Candidatus Thorarchaeota archaeon]
DILSAWSFDSPYPNWYAQGYSGLPLYPLYGGYQLFGGTSAAGPHVAGAAALMVQLNDNCGMVVKDLIEASAYNDVYTGALPVYPALGTANWGYGKLNACAALEEVSKLPVVHEVTVDPQTPEYTDIVTISMNVTGAGSVHFDWSFNNWSSGHPSTLNLSAGLYSATIPAHGYGVRIDYIFWPVNPSAVVNPNVPGSYVVDDTVGPSIDSFYHNATAYAVDPTWVEVAVQATEPVNASGIAGADIEFSVDNWASTNYVALSWNGTHFTGHVPPSPAPLTMKFRVVVHDYAMNSASTAEVSYNIVTALPTTTTSTTGGTTSGNWLQDNLYLIAAGAAVLVLIIIVMACRKRK